MLDYLLIGAGPAGLQLGYFLEKAGRGLLNPGSGTGAGHFFSYLSAPSTAHIDQQAHTGFDDPELNLRMDWNSLLSGDPRLRFTRYTERYFPAAEDMVQVPCDFAAASRLRIRYDTQVVRIMRDGCFRAIDQHERIYEAKRLIVATGVSKPYIPPIPGIETAELYGTVSVNPRDFVNQRVLIIGKGNSGFETAENLVETAAVIHIAGPRSICMAWRSHYVGHLRAVNNNVLDTYQLKSQNALLDGNIERIERRDDAYIVTVRFSRGERSHKGPAVRPGDRMHGLPFRCLGFCRRLRTGSRHQ